MLCHRAVFGIYASSIYQDLEVQRTDQRKTISGVLDSAEQTCSVLFCMYNSPTSNFGAGLFAIWKAVKCCSVCKSRPI